MDPSRLRQRRGIPPEAGGAAATSEGTLAAVPPRRDKCEAPSHPNASSSKNTPREYVTLYIILSLVRVILTHLFLHSYFDPDEFWQTMEPAYCAVFGDHREYACQGRTWEWQLRSPLSTHTTWLHRSILAVGPARSFLNVIPTILFYQLLRTVNWDTHFWIARGPLYVHVLLVTVPVDLLTYSIAQRLYEKETKTPPHSHNTARWCLFASLTSWFHSYTTTRTFANAYETLLLLVAIRLVCLELFQQSSPNPPGSFSGGRAAGAFIVGGLSVAIRNTAVLSFVPLGVLLAVRRIQGTTRWSNFYRVMQYILYPCATFGALGLLLSVVIDRYFFGYWSLPVLSNLYFNVVLNHASLYGAHPGFWYWAIALPTLSGLLFPFLVFAGIMDLLQCTRRYSMNSAKKPILPMFYNRIQLWMLLGFYVGILSWNRHKEFRYILPMLPLICILTAPHLQSFFLMDQGSKSKTRGHSVIRWMMGTMWILANLLTLAYLGLFHQSGPVAVNHEIVALATSDRSTVLQRSNGGFVPQVASIHYLTGACHSTPLHSHLHTSVVEFDTWHLDCSPTCRVAAAMPGSPYTQEGCETHQFIRNPLHFIQQSYCISPTPMSLSCRTPPDYMVTFSEYMTREMTDVLLQAPFHLRILPQRFAHHLRGVRIQLPFGGGTYRFGSGWEDDHGMDEAMFGYQTILPGILDVNWHAVILLVRSVDLDVHTT